MSGICSSVLKLSVKIDVPSRCRDEWSRSSAFLYFICSESQEQMNILKTGWDLVWPFFVGWVRSSVLPWRPWIISLSTWARSSECVWWLMDGLMPWYSWMNMELNPNMQILRHDLWDVGWFMRLLWFICISDHTTRLPIPDTAPYGKSRSEMTKCWRSPPRGKSQSETIEMSRVAMSRTSFESLTARLREKVAGHTRNIQCISCAYQCISRLFTCELQKRHEAAMNKFARRCVQILAVSVCMVLITQFYMPSNGSAVTCDF